MYSGQVGTRPETDLTKPRARRDASTAICGLASKTSQRKSSGVRTMTPRVMRCPASKSVRFHVSRRWRACDRRGRHVAIAGCRCAGVVDQVLPVARIEVRDRRSHLPGGALWSSRILSGLQQMPSAVANPLVLDGPGPVQTEESLDGQCHQYVSLLLGKQDIGIGQSRWLAFKTTVLRQCRRSLRSLRRFRPSARSARLRWL